MVKTYPILEPPFEDLDRAAWSIKQARAYFDWLMSVKEERARMPFEYLDVLEQKDAVQTLLQLGEASSGHLRTKSFFNAKAETLTAQGHSLAADMGLLLAKYLCRDFPVVHWELGRGSKRNVGYNLPVLVGFGGIRGLKIDPIGGAITVARSIASRRAPPSAWAESYERTAELVSAK